MKIIFTRTGNVYLNAGIVGIRVALEKYDEWRSWSEPTLPALPEHTSFWDEDRNALCIETDHPKELFERLYQAMGRVYYNTSTTDALSRRTNFYYVPETKEMKPFPKMKTYGFGALLTNDAAGKTPSPDNTIRRSTIQSDDAFGQELLAAYEAKFAEEDLKLGQQLYVNEPYAKITRLELDGKDFKSGKYVCPLTGESFGRLHKATNVSPTSGSMNFMPQLSTKGEKIGWKALYAVRFAPVLALYRYTGGLDVLYCYFYDHPRLSALHNLYQNLRSEIYLDDIAKQKVNHLNNIALKELDLGGKGTKLSGNDFVHPNEVLFQLVYSLTDALYGDEDTDEAGIQDADFEEGMNLYLLRADKFAGTMRANTFTAFNHFNYVRRYIEAAKAYQVEGFKGQKKSINWAHVLASLRIHLPGQERDWAKERIVREAVLKKLIHGQSFLEEIKTIFLGGYVLRLSGDNAGFKRWDQLALLTKFDQFGPLNNYTSMEKEIRRKAYDLGTQIGQAMLNDETTGDSAGDRAKFGRKYIIDLDKSRTYVDLLEALKRIQLRYNTFIKKDLVIDFLTDRNFKEVKLLATIAALNSINGKLYLSSKKSENPA